MSEQLPARLDAERSVLACLVRDPVLTAAALDRLTPDHFSAPAHGHIFEAIVALAKRSHAIDRLTLAAELDRLKLLSEVGGPEYLGALELDLPDESRWESYVDILEERMLRRRMAHAAEEFRKAAFAGADSRQSFSELQAQVLAWDPDRDRDPTLALGEVLPLVLDSLERPHGQLLGHSTGFADVDRQTLGYESRKLWLVAGRPGMGKTTWALNSLVALAKQGHPAAYFTMEMTREEIAQFILSSQASVKLRQIRENHLSDRQRANLRIVAGELEKLPIFIDDSSSMTVLRLGARARRLKAEHGLATVFVDHVNLLETPRGFDTTESAVGANSRGLKQLAKDLGVTVVGLCQLSREVEKRSGLPRPKLADLRGSGAWEQDADLVAFLFREEYYRDADYTGRHPEIRGAAEWILAKNRGGSTGVLPLYFAAETVTFKNAAREAEQGALPE